MTLFGRHRPQLDEIASLELFADVSKRDLRQIQDHTHRIRIKAGDVVMLERFSGEQFLVILQGRVAVMRGDERIATLGVGDFIGEIGMLTGSDRTASVFAETEAKFLVFDAGPFERFIRGHPKVRARVEAAAQERAYGDEEGGNPV